MHGLRHRAVRHRGQGRDRPGEFRTRRPHRPDAATNYTFYYNCTGTAPAFLPNSGQFAPYTIINRYDAASTTVPDETRPAIPARRVADWRRPPRPIPPARRFPWDALGIGDPLEAVWSSPTVHRRAARQCAAALPQVARSRAVRPVLARGQYDPACRLHHRRHRLFGTGRRRARRTRTQATTQDLYTAYSGNGRRVITVAVVDALAPNTGTPMTVLGFRQFLLQPNPDGTPFNPADTNGRFVATYIGSPMPVKQGYIDDRFGLELSGSGDFGSGKGGTPPMRRGRSGSMAIELAMWLPVHIPADRRHRPVRQDHLHLLLAAEDDDRRGELPGGAERASISARTRAIPRSPRPYSSGSPGPPTAAAPRPSRA